VSAPTVAVLLAAHGARGTDNEPVERLARDLRRRHVAGEVATAYHQGGPGFAAALAALAAPRVVVVPVFTSDGHYARVVLPAELRRSPGFRPGRVVITPPLGTHPDLPALVARRLRLEEADLLCQPGAELAVVGHGTRRHPGSAAATRALAAALARLRVAPRVRAVFLDQDPAVETLGADPAPGPLVVFPFLLGGGDHLASDLPRRLGLAGHGPGAARVALARPLGALPGLAALVAALCRAHLPPAAA
jgi:sirohydrochlorin cobaltochelatase